MKTDGRSHVLSLEFDISRAGWDLKQQISDASGIESLRLKLIASGKVIDDYMPLKDQNINLKVSVYSKGHNRIDLWQTTCIMKLCKYMEVLWL